MQHVNKNVEEGRIVVHAIGSLSLAGVGDDDMPFKSRDPIVIQGHCLISNTILIFSKREVVIHNCFRLLPLFTSVLSTPIITLDIQTIKQRQLYSS